MGVEGCVGGGCPPKANVDEALVTSPLSAFISNHTHKVTARPPEFKSAADSVTWHQNLVGDRVSVCCCERGSDNQTKITTDTRHQHHKNKKSFAVVLSPLTLLDLCHKRRRQTRKKDKIEMRPGAV